MKRMLINATHSEEVRVAIADGQKLFNLDIDVPGQDRKKGNIYKAKITRVEPSLEAAFVDYGADRHGFLPYKEISRSYYTQEALNSKERLPISQAVKEGTEVIIQVNKEERGNKGAAVSTYISLAGRYLVYMPENPKAGGISRRIEGKTRQELKAVMQQVNMPKDAGVIVRTAGVGRSVEEIEWDLNYLDQVWTAIKSTASSRPGPFFIYQESDLHIRALRDYLRPDIGEILVDDRKMYEKAREFMQQVMPHNLKKLSYYNDTTPLFSRYQIESQIQSAFSREVHLPSGGSLVIDHTEAMIAIDINSAKATKGADIEETALNTNLEAADEIARQLRIRDLGGLVVIDFIDMRLHKNQRLVEQQLNEAVSNDRARVQTSKISRFGLLEMSRQRLRSSINESSQFVCPRCSGHGFIRNIESLVVSILRIMEEEALKPETGKVVAQVPNKVANFIMNEKRDELSALETRHSVPMVVVANEYFQTPQFDIKRLKKYEANQFALDKVELQKPESEEQADKISTKQTLVKQEEAAIDVISPESQAPSRSKSKSFTTWLAGLFSAKKKKPAAKSNQKKASSRKPYSKRNNKSNNKPNNNSNNRAGSKQNNYQSKKKKPYSAQKNNKQNTKVQNQKQAQKQTQNSQQKTAKGKPAQQNKKPAQAKNQRKPKPNHASGNKQQTGNQPKAANSGSNQANNAQKPKGNAAANAQNTAKQKASKPASKPKTQGTHEKVQDNQQQVGKQTNKQANQPKDSQPSSALNDKMARPLGSVASYAAQKAKSSSAPEPTAKQSAKTNDAVDKKVQDKAKAVQNQGNKSDQANLKPKVDAKAKDSVKKKANKKPAENLAKDLKQNVNKPPKAPQPKTQAKPKTSKPKGPSLDFDVSFEQPKVDVKKMLAKESKSAPKKAQSNSLDFDI